MQVLLLVAMVIVGASGLYVAATFDTRVTRKVDHLIKDAVSGELEVRLRSAEGRLAGKLDGVSGWHRAVQKGLAEVETQIKRTDSKFSEITRQISSELGAVKKDVQVIGASQAGLGSLAQDTSDQVQIIARQVQEISGQAAELSANAERSEALTRRDLADVHASLREVNEAHSYARAQLTEIENSLASFSEVSDLHGIYESWITVQLVEVARHMETLLRGQHDIVRFLCSNLDEQVLSADAGRGRRVVSSSLRLSGSADDIIREQFAAFCDQMMFKVILAAPPDSAGRGPYLAWRSPDGRSLEDSLASLLGMCENEEEKAQDHPGLDELRSLLLVLHEEGPGTIQVGPMVLNRTPGALLGCVLAAGESTGIHPAPLPGSPGECEEWLRGLGEERVTDLTSWAGGYPA